jgi:hypothetical protein
MRILLAGILGGIVMFIWTSIAHVALPLGEAGIRKIPNESAVLSTMQCNIALFSIDFRPSCSVAAFHRYAHLR